MNKDRLTSSEIHVVQKDGNERDQRSEKGQSVIGIGSDLCRGQFYFVATSLTQATHSARFVGQLSKSARGLQASSKCAQEKGNCPNRRSMRLLRPMRNIAHV